jgi:hypothetical protein
VDSHVTEAGEGEEEPAAKYVPDYPIRAIRIYPSTAIEEVAGDLVRI